MLVDVRLQVTPVNHTLSTAGRCDTAGIPGTVANMSLIRAARAAVTRQRPWIQRLVVTTAAVTTAWAVGGMLSRTDGLIAAILAAVTLRVSLQASLSEGIVQLLGTAIGVGVAFAAMSVVGTGSVAVALTAAVSFAAARALRLGEGGVINIVITALIVLGPGMPTDTAVDRTLGTLLGVATALLFSYWAHPSTPVGRTQELLAALSRETSELLHAIGDGVANGYDRDDAADWLEKARALTNRVSDARFQAEEAVLYARWSPIASKDEADAVFARYVAVEHLVVQTRNIARSVFEAGTNRFASQVGGIIGPLLAAAADLVARKASNVSTDVYARVEPAALRSLRRDVASASEALRHAENKLLLNAASVLTAVERIADSLAIDTPAIAEVGTPLSTTTPLMQMKEAAIRLTRRGRGG